MSRSKTPRVESSRRVQIPPSPPGRPLRAGLALAPPYDDGVRFSPAQVVRALDLRAAVVHLIDIAVCHERAGALVPDEGSTRTLARVVRLLFEHQRRRQGLRVREAELMAAVAGVYRAVRRQPDMSKPEQEARLIRACATQRLKLSVSALARLTRSADQIVAARGPVECAAISVGKILGRSPRTMATRRKEALRFVGWSLPVDGPARRVLRDATAFGESATRAEMARYVGRLLMVPSVQKPPTAAPQRRGFPRGLRVR